MVFETLIPFNFELAIIEVVLLTNCIGSNFEELTIICRKYLLHYEKTFYLAE